MEHLPQGNVPLRHLLNAKALFMSWQRSVFNEVNDWSLGVIFADGPLWQNQRKFMAKTLKEMSVGAKPFESHILDEYRLFHDDLKYQIKMVLWTKINFSFIWENIQFWKSVVFCLKGYEKKFLQKTFIQQFLITLFFPF